ncbi:MAG: glucosaminidase domain-containing protein [Stellaceae bacterium]
MNDGGDAAESNVEPAAASDDTQAKKERFVDAHLADAQKAADQLDVPVENILGLSALESGWGNERNRFVAAGRNYFGIHDPAPFANCYMLTADGRTRVATFASYADSLQSFVALSGSIIRGKDDPTAFAAALQDSGKFGIYPETGAKVPTYVRDVARTIRGLRPIVARRRL